MQHSITSQSLSTFFVSFMLVSFFHYVRSTEYHDCIGTSSECCIKRELFAGDKVVLETKPGVNVGAWCNQVFVVRQTEQHYDECKGCTLSIEFVETNFKGGVELREANYTSVSYTSSETLYLQHLAEYRYPGGNHFPSDTLHTTSTVLKFLYDSTLNESGTLQIFVTPHVPQSSATITVILAISVPLVVIFVIFNLALYKLRQRRIARARAALSAQLTALVLDAERDAHELREARALQRARHPRSPDPNDSVAPPSYAESAPPPKYEDVVGTEPASCLPSPLPTNNAPDALPEDSAGPDHGRDSDLLVV